MNSLTTSGSGSLRSCLHNDHRPDAPLRTTGRSSTAFCGCSRPAHRGATSPNALDPGRRSIVASDAGNRPESGSASWPICNGMLMRLDSSTGRSTTSIQRSFARISMQLVQKGGPSCRGIRPQPGRVFDQAAPAGRGLREARDLRPDARSAARSDRGRAVVRTGRRPAGRTRATAHPTGTRGRRQGLQQPTVSTLSAPSRDAADDSTAQQSTGRRIIRSGSVSWTESRRTPHQPAQTIPTHRDALRETRCELPGDAHHRHDSTVVVGFADTP